MSFICSNEGVTRQRVTPFRFVRAFPPAPCTAAQSPPAFLLLPLQQTFRATLELPVNGALPPPASAPCPVLVLDVKGGRLNILLIDDDPDEVSLVDKALRQTAAGDTVQAVRDGQEAIDYLHGKDKFHDRQSFPFPNVILCALKNPRMGGFDLLRWLRAHPECSVIPKIIYSSSAADEDVREAYVLGANSYILKPTELQEMADTLQNLYEFWSRCEVPDTARSC